jgi:prepilin-type N-terminal cleavage/methylation domain-containing protein
MIRKAFTLIELLVVIAIIAILAAILFPVFAQAKASAKKAAAISNFKQMMLAALMYAGDSDDHFPIVTYNNTLDANPAHPDSVPQLLMQPYIKNKPLMNDPMDFASDTDRIHTEQAIEPESRPAYFQQQTDLNYAYKSDWGINWQFVMPLWWDPSSNVNGGLHPYAISQTEVAKPGNMIFAIDSVWNRSPSGAPYGGGNIALDPPCIFDLNVPGVDTRPGAGAFGGYYWYGGWNPSQPLSWNVFGGAWPWHTNGKIAVISFMDGHTKAMSISQTTVGCNVQDAFGGLITNESVYMWGDR